MGLEFFNTHNTATINKNGQMLLYPFALVVKLEAIDKDTGAHRALSFNYFHTDEEIFAFLDEVTEAFNLEIIDKR